jgi:outer membrane protein assembly factor BamB
MGMKDLFSVAVVIVCTAVAQASDWPDWRGPTADGHSDATGLPLTWSETENIRWKTPIHDFGHSTPIVKDGQIWLTTATKKGTALFAVCIDLGSGKIIHDIEVFHPNMTKWIHPVNSYATPSVVIEKNRVYVHFGAFGTACIDSNSGEVLWRQTELKCEHMQGPASSPLLFDDLLIVDLEGVDVQFMAAMNKHTGEVVWKKHRAPELYYECKPFYFKKAYQTPVIEVIDGQPQLISNGSQLVSGHDPATGKEIWRVVYGGDSTISRIVSGHGLFFVNTGGPPRGTRLWAIRQGGMGDLTKTHVAWEVKEDVPLETSPVLVGDLLYMISDNGILTCLEAKTGKAVWSKRLKGKYGASLLYADNRIYVSNKQGKTTVLKPGPTFEILAENKLDAGFWASPAVADKSILLRSKTHLYRIGQ